MRGKINKNASPPREHLRELTGSAAAPSRSRSPHRGRSPRAAPAAPSRDRPPRPRPRPRPQPLTLRLLHGALVEALVVGQRGDVRRRQQLGPRRVEPGLLLGLHHGGRRRL